MTDVRVENNSLYLLCHLRKYEGAIRRDQELNVLGSTFEKLIIETGFIWWHILIPGCCMLVLIHDHVS